MSPPPLVIEKLYSWVATEADGGEGIAGYWMGQWMMPLIGADSARVESLRPYAQMVATETGRPVVLKMFDRGLAIDRVLPGGGVG